MRLIAAASALALLAGCGGERSPEPEPDGAPTPAGVANDQAQYEPFDLPEEFILGTWVSQGLADDCESPDFVIERSPGAIVFEATVNGEPETAEVILGDYPRLDRDEPLPDLPIERREEDSMAILRPATDANFEPLSIGASTLEGDGVVYVKCG